MNTYNMSGSVSIITTVYNERDSISPFLQSLISQSRVPDEIVIVDANSPDGTAGIIRAFAAAHVSVPIKLLVQAGNRSVGRNTAIEIASSEIIAATDAGCTAHEHWLEELIKPFEDPVVDFVGGWYQPRVQTDWDAAVAIVLDFTAERVSERRFLPSTRSMAFRKKLWSTVGGFDVTNSDSEDTPFSIAMRKVAKKFVFAPAAIVEWSLVGSYLAIYKTIRRYAQGDGRGRIWTSQYQILLAGILLVLALILLSSLFPILLIFLICAVIGYLYLPTIIRHHIPRGAEWYRIPFLRATIIFANCIGYVNGLMYRPTTK